MRRRLRRRLQCKYQSQFYKPQGVPMRALDIIEISKEELETMRLRFLENKTQAEAAKQMGISQSQYQRDLWEANRKVTEALINGSAIRL